jgi:hypothetical protein
MKKYILALFLVGILTFSAATPAKADVISDLTTAVISLQQQVASLQAQLGFALGALKSSAIAVPASSISPAVNIPASPVLPTPVSSGNTSSQASIANTGATPSSLEACIISFTGDGNCTKICKNDGVVTLQYSGAEVENGDEGECVPFAITTAPSTGPSVTSSNLTPSSPSSSPATTADTSFDNETPPSGLTAPTQSGTTPASVVANQNNNPADWKEGDSCTVIVTTGSGAGFQVFNGTLDKNGNCIKLTLTGSPTSNNANDTKSLVTGNTGPVDATGDPCSFHRDDHWGDIKGTIDANGNCIANAIAVTPNNPLIGASVTIPSLTMTLSKGENNSQINEEIGFLLQSKPIECSNHKSYQKMFCYL